MKKLLLAILLVASAAVCAFGQSNPPLTVTEVDGSPRGTNITTIKVSNGTLSISGHTATITTGGGGGGGCTPPGTASRVLYDDGVGGCTSTSGLTATSTIATMTNGRFVTAINDSAGNELIKLTATGSAVNEITLANAATGNNPTITASGGDSDVGFNFLVKGAGVYRFLASTSGPSDFRLFEDADNGSNYVSLIPAASLASDFVLTLPSATDTLVGKATTDTFINKTYDTAGSGNTFKINGTAITAISGNTATVATTSGTLTSGNCAKFDANGNIVDNGAVCGGGGSGITIGTTTITSGTVTRLLYETSGNVVGEISGATSNGTSVTFSSGNLIATDAALTTPAITTSATVTRTSLGTTTAAGVELTNTTAAAAGAQQVSPATIWTGQGWKTNATAASQTVNWQAYVLPVQGAANPTANWVLQSQVNGGGYSDRLAVTSAGQLLAGAGSASAPAYSFSAATNTGLANLSSGASLVAGGSESLRATSSRVFIISGTLVTNTIILNTSTDDLFLRRSAAANLSLTGTTSTTPATINTPANTPAQITANQNNYAPGTGWFQRWSSDASRNITGLTAGVDGQIIEIWNVGSQNIVLQNENASSTAANRFTTSTGADLTLAASKCAKARYDATSARWRVYLCN